MVAAGGDGWVLTDWFENAFLRIGGPEKYDRLARHEIPWTDPAVVETLTLGAYWRTPRTILGGPVGAPQITFDQSIADVFGATPRAAMLFEGDFVAADITRLGRSRVGETAKVFPWPSIKDSVPAVVVAGDQAVQLKDTPGARAVMQCRDGRPYLSWLVALPMGPRLAVLALVPLLALRPRHGRWRVWLAASAGATGADEHRRR